MSKTAIISIPECATSHVLTSMQDNNMKCNYLGIDQGGKILMEVTYEITQEDLMGHLNKHIIKSEEILTELYNSYREYIKIQDKESDEVLKKIKEKLAQINNKHNNYKHGNGK